MTVAHATDFVDSEINAIGHCLARESCMEVAASMQIAPHHFSDVRNRTIWERMLEFFHKGDPVNIETIGCSLANEIKDDCVLQVAACAGTYHSSTTFVYFAKQLIQRHQKLLAMQRIGEVGRLIPMSDFKDVRENITQFLDENLIVNEDGVSEDIQTVMHRIGEDLERRAEEFAHGKPRGIPTGFRRLDRITGGFMPGQVYILGGRTSMGKTMLAINFATSAIRSGKSIAYFTVEMKGEKILERMLSAQARVLIENINSGNLSGEECDRLTGAMSELFKSKGRLSHKFNRSIAMIEQETIRLVARGECQFLIIDYIQQLQVDGKRNENRHQELSEISGRIQALANRLDIPTLVLAQVKREVANKSGKKESEDYRPHLHHIKDCGSIEQDADVVMFIHRDSYYDIDDPKDWIIVAKNRDGPTGDMEISSELRFCRFGDPEPTGGSVTTQRGDWD